MDALILFAVLLLNVLISVWNCYAVGSAWKDTMAMGGWFNKTVLWSAVIQSGVGFSMPILLVLAYGSSVFLTSGAEPMLTPEEAKEMMQAIFSLWYVAVIFPILGSGLAIWAHSLREAYRRRDFASIATAGWNSFAQIHNTVSAVNNIGGALGNMGELFGKALEGKGDGKGKVAILVILLVVISIVAGFMIAFGLVRYFANRAESRIEEFAASGMARRTA
jgi:formate/nitrite transporter FocA (FNT family)